MYECSDHSFIIVLKKIDFLVWGKGDRVEPTKRREHHKMLKETSLRPNGYDAEVRRRMLLCNEKQAKKYGDK